MRYLVIVFLFISSFISGQGIEPTSLQPTQYQGGILRGVIPYVDEFTGETLYIYQHVDSLAFIKDSIYVRNDSIFLRDGTGFAIVTDSIYVVTGVSKDTIKLRDGDGYVLMDKQSQSRVRGTGTATQVAWFAASDSISSDSAFYWDNTNKRLGIGTTTPNAIVQIANHLTFDSPNQSIYMGYNVGGFPLAANTAIGNTAFGYNALNSINSSSVGDNVAIGVNAMRGLTTGTANVALGADNMIVATSASNNIAIGDFALGGITTGTYNLGIGSQALKSVTSAIQNTAIGGWAGSTLTTGNLNVAIGNDALRTANTSSQNVAIGAIALRATTAGDNTGIGTAAGYSVSTGQRNILIGSHAATSLTTGSNNIVLGYNIDLPSVSSSNMLDIGNLIYATGLNGSGTNISSGNVGIATTQPARTLHVNGAVRISNLTTDSPIKLVGADADGDLNDIILGTGLSLTGNTLNGAAGSLTGSGVANEVAYFNGPSSITSSPNYFIQSNNMNVLQNFDVNTTGSIKGFRRIISGLAHGVTNKLPTDVAWGFTDYSGASYPNFYMVGVGKTSVPIMSYDLVRLDNPTGTYFDLTAGYKSGVSTTTADDAAALFRITNNGSARFTIYGNGGARISSLAGTGNRMVIAGSSGDLSTQTINTFGNGLTDTGGAITANINGTANRVAKFTSQYAVGNSQIYTVADSLVGINQSNPVYHLDVSGKFRVTQRTGTAATGAGFTSDGQLVAYSLDTAASTPNTYVQSGTNISVTGAGTMGDPYTINNTAPENTTVKDSDHLDFSELSNDTITATIKTASIGATELASSGVSSGSYTLASITVDQDGRITSASSGTAGTVTSVSASTPLASSGGTTPNITIQNATTAQSGALTSTDWNTFNNKIGGSGTTNQIAYFNGSSSLTRSANYFVQDNNINAADNFDVNTTGAYKGFRRIISGLNHGVTNKLPTDMAFGFTDYGSASYPNFYLVGVGKTSVPVMSFDMVRLDNPTQPYLSFDMGYKSGVSTTTVNSAAKLLRITNNTNEKFGVTGNGDMFTYGALYNSGGSSGSSGQVLTSQGTGAWTWTTPATGTVTSVGVTAGTGISASVSNATTTPNITITNTGVTSLSGLSGSISLSTTNSGTYPNWFNSGNTLYYALPSGSSGQVLKHNGTGWTASADNDTDTDNQTLSFSSPNLSISGGNSVALPVLPSGTATSNTLRWGGSSWAETSMLKTTTARVDINSWPGTVNLGSKLLVNGHIQYTNTGFQASTITGRDTDGGLTGVTVGSGLSLSSGTLSYSPVYAEVSYIGPSSAITTWTSIPWNQTAISNGMTTSSSGITIPTTANYRIDYSVHGAFSNNTLTGYSGMTCRVFSAGIKGTRTEKVYHSNTQTQDLTISHQSVWANLSAGTLVYIEVDDVTTSGSTLTITAANLIVTKL